MLVNLKGANIFALLFILPPLFYIIFLCIYGIDRIDSGFVLSFVGRLDIGQTIYKDFDLVRPFGNVIFWDLLLKIIPKDSEYLLIIARLIFILESLAIAYFLTKIAKPVSSITTFFVLTFILFIHHFNLMPWHTVDGIFLGIIAIYLCQKKHFLSAIILTLITASTKQSFYIFAILSIFLNLCLIIKNNYKIEKKDICLSFIFLLIISLIIYKYSLLDNFALFLKQTNSSSSLRQLYQAGLKAYFFSSWYSNIAFFILLVFVYFYNGNRFKKFLFYVSAFALAIGYLLPLIPRLPNNYTNLLFVYFFILFIKYKKSDHIGYLIFILSWCSSLSWGYNSPIFLIGFIFLYIFKDLLTSKFLIISCMIMLILFSFIRLTHPYYNKSSLETSYVLCSDLPTISGIYMPKETYLLYKEGVEIQKKYKKIIFIPGDPMLDVMTKSFYNRASWEMDVEYPTNTTDNSLNDRSLFFAVDKNPIIKYKSGFFKSTYTNTILETRVKIDSTKSYYIYK